MVIDKMHIKIHIKILDERMTTTHTGCLPRRHSTLAAGYDLRAMRIHTDICTPIHEEFVIRKGERIVVGTGIALDIADPSICGMVVPRSGLGRHGIVLSNLVGIIDADYQGEVMVALWNASNLDYAIEPMERIAQLIFVKIASPKFEIVQSLEPTQRGQGGFGSTGK